MRYSMIAPLAAAIALAGCGGGDADADGNGEITREEAAAEMASGGAMAMQPGQWEQTIEFTDVRMPGMPESMQDMVKQQLGGKVTTQHCLTPEQVAKPEADFFKGEGQDDCTYQQFDRSGNALAIKMTCDGGQGGKVNVVMNGQFDAETFTLDMDNTVTGSPTGDMHMKGRITGRRIGDCAG